MIPCGTFRPALDAFSAILLRKTKLTDSSLILSWMSDRHGRLKTVAKGARRAKSRFAGVLDLFHRCEIAIARSRRSDLHVLREAVLLDPCEGIRTDYTRVTLAGYFVELLELVTEPEHPAPELYDLLQRALAHLGTQRASKRALIHYEGELVRLLGISGSEATPAVALGRVYNQLPRGRRGLLATLPEAA